MAMQSDLLKALATAVGTDIKTLQASLGSLSGLTTVDKTNIVAALNEINQKVASASGINDGSTSTATTWSSNQIQSAINTAVSNIVNGAGTTLDTLKELADALGNDPSFATTIATALGKRVRVDAAQTFTVDEQKQGCANLGIGDPTVDYVAVYTAAKA